jgi:hypothetical protein
MKLLILFCVVGAALAESAADAKADPSILYSGYGYGHGGGGYGGYGGLGASYYSYPRYVNKVN